MKAKASLKGLFTTAVALGLLAISPYAASAPIVYESELIDGVPATGTNMQGAGSSSTPAGANYFLFQATAGNAVTIWGDRLAGHYDMSFWVFAGQFTDTAAFGPSFDGGDPGFIDFGDDEDPPNIGGPFGDPRSVFVAPVSGYYTVAVTNFLSSAGPPNPFRLTATGIPEPGTLALAGLALAGLGFSRRKRS